jgi:hypothetical protein
MDLVVFQASCRSPDVRKGMVQLPGVVIFDQCELGWEMSTIVLVHEGCHEKFFDRLHGSCARVLRPVCGGNRWMLGEDGEVAAGDGLRCHLKKVCSLGSERVTVSQNLYDSVTVSIRKCSGLLLLSKHSSFGRLESEPVSSMDRDRDTLLFSN